MQSFKAKWSPKLNCEFSPARIELVACDDELTDAAGLGTVVDLFDRSPMAQEFAKCLPERTSSRSMGVN